MSWGRQMDIPMIQSKLPSCINKDMLPFNKKKMKKRKKTYKTFSDLYCNTITLSRYLKEKKRKKEKKCQPCPRLMEQSLRFLSMKMVF